MPDGAMSPLWFVQKEIQQRQEHLEDLQARLDRVHKAQQEAEEEEEVLQQLKLACILPEEQQREVTGLHHLSGLLQDCGHLLRCSPWSVSSTSQLMVVLQF